MTKTIVNIITDNSPIPAYLFIKEMYNPGDRIMYISAKDTEDDLEWLSFIDGVSTDFIGVIVLKHDIDEFKYEKICRAVKAYLKDDVYYCVNLAGGTRYMALAVQHVFDEFTSEFFYTNLEDNTIIHSKFDKSIYDNDDLFYPIRYRMKIAEYLQAHELGNDLESSNHDPLLPFPFSKNMFELFTQKHLTGHDFKILELLRMHYLNRKNGVPLSEIECPKVPKVPAAPDIRRFLKFVSFPFSDDMLAQEQLAWLSGGWFEEYVYYMVKVFVEPDDIALRVSVFRKGVPRNNELDVMFIKNNRLYVIECKTGVSTERMFNDVVYKACALKESLFGLSCDSYIVSLKDDPTGNLKKIAMYMGIEFWDNNIVVNNLEQVLKDIKQQSAQWAT